MKTCKYGCGKMKSGSKVATDKKMKTGGNTGGYAPAQKGGDNVKMGIYGIPNAGRTDSLGFKKGGSTTSRAVKTSCKGGLVTDFDGKCVTERKMKSGGPLKPVPAGKVGLSKLPIAVRNKMGYAKKGGIKKR
jgi:hypothetical protein